MKFKMFDEVLSLKTISQLEQFKFFDLKLFSSIIFFAHSFTANYIRFLYHYMLINVKDNLS